MNLGSHNSFTYLPIKKWWMRPFAWIAKCQRIDIFSQFLLGVRLFDIRVRFNKKKEMVICHGLMEYKFSKKDLYYTLGILQFYGDVYIRVILETSEPDLDQESGFYFFCLNLERDFPKIHFFGGNNKTDWYCQNPIYKFNNPLEDIEHKYSSPTTLFEEEKNWMKYLDDWCPFIYAKLRNKRNYKQGTTHKWLMMDFVDIK